MARPERFERPTPKFVAWCSIQLSYGRARARIIWKGSGPVKKSGCIKHMGNESPSNDTKKFHGWRLIGVIMIVIAMLAVVSAIVDWVVLQ